MVPICFILFVRKYSLSLLTHGGPTACVVAVFTHCLVRLLSVVFCLLLNV